MTVKNLLKKFKKVFPYISSEQFPPLKTQEYTNPVLDAFSIVLSYLPNEWPIIFLDFSGRDIIRLTNLESVSSSTAVKGACWGPSEPPPPPPPGLLFFLPDGNLLPILFVLSVLDDCVSVEDDWVSVLVDSESVVDDLVSVLDVSVTVLDDWVSVLDDWVSVLDGWVFKFSMFPPSSVWGHADGLAKTSEHPGLGLAGGPPPACLFLLPLGGPPPTPPPPAPSAWSQ